MHRLARGWGQKVPLGMDEGGLYGGRGGNRMQEMVAGMGGVLGWLQNILLI